MWKKFRTELGRSGSPVYSERPRMRAISRLLVCRSGAVARVGESGGHPGAAKSQCRRTRQRSPRSALVGARIQVESSRREFFRETERDRQRPRKRRRSGSSAARWIAVIAWCDLTAGRALVRLHLQPLASVGCGAEAREDRLPSGSSAAGRKGLPNEPPGAGPPRRAAG